MLLIQNLPVHAAYKFNVSEKAKLSIFAGPYFAYGIGGKTKARGYGKANTFGSEGFDRFDFGLGIGLGLEVEKLAFNLGYDFGLIDISDTDGGSIKNRNWYLSVGYKFKLQ